MSKAILVVDMPAKCYDCDFHYLSDGTLPCCQLKFKAVEDAMTKPSWCPLKPLPSIDEYAFGDWDEGYRACLENILGET